MKFPQDAHSHSRPNEAFVTHLSWEATVDFRERVIIGTANWNISVFPGAKEIVFDTRDLLIEEVLLNSSEPASFSLGEPVPFLGSPLRIQITESTRSVSIKYRSSPDAAALLWVEGENPFLFTQSQAILARTWIPCQDSPGIRFTYEADVIVPENLMALMSASNPREKSPDGRYRFRMEQRIPSYLMALAVGDVEFRSLGERCGIYAIPSLADTSAWEFAETEQMLESAEALYGPYAWGRYDLLILPPAFPFGGMENPRLTFATPTIIAGDRSLTALVAHEMAHSWSGNLVTNATWNDFWLNEGFTVYFEQRIMEAVYGKEISEMLVALSYQGLLEEAAEIASHNPEDTHLKLKLEGRDPDEGMSAIAYDKGYFFLRLIEETIGRARWDAFVKGYFEKYAFGIMDTETFLEYLKANLLSAEEQQKVNIEAWVYGAGIPENCPVVKSARISRVDSLMQEWKADRIATEALPWKEWKYQEQYRFLSNMPAEGGAKHLEALDAAFAVGSTGNNEVLFAWLLKAVQSDYTPAYPRLESFLVNVGRRKFLTPLYKAMKETGKETLAMEIYRKARPNYHSVAKGTMDELLGFEGEN
jgi:aminopeptidase N